MTWAAFPSTTSWMHAANEQMSNKLYGENKSINDICKWVVHQLATMMSPLWGDSLHPKILFNPVGFNPHQTSSLLFAIAEKLNHFCIANGIKWFL